MDIFGYCVVLTAQCEPDRRRCAIRDSHDVASGRDCPRTCRNRGSFDLETSGKEATLKSPRITLAFLAVLALPSTLFAARAAEVLGGDTLHFAPEKAFAGATLTVTGPEGYTLDQSFAGGSVLTVDLGAGLADGRYKYRIKLDPTEAGARPRFIDNLFFVQDGVAVSRAQQREKIGGFKARLQQMKADATTVSETRRANRAKYPFASRPGPALELPEGGTVPYTFPYTTFPEGLCVGYFCPDYTYDPLSQTEGLNNYPRVRNPLFAGFGLSTVPYGPFATGEDGPGYYGYGSTWYTGAFGPLFIMTGYPYGGYAPAQGDGYGYGFPFMMDSYTGNLALGGSPYFYGDGGDGPGFYYGIEAPLTVTRFDGSAQALIVNNGSGGSRSQLLALESDGPVELTLTDLSKDATWKLGTRAGNKFELNFGGSGQTELSFNKNGDLTILGTLFQGSSRAIKENFQPVDGAKMLEQVLALPLLRWNYKARPPEDDHLGPMAEDFYATFGLGESETTLAPGDAAGVALAAIQGLHAELEERDAEILRLRRQIGEIVAMVEELQSVSGEP